MLRRIALLLCSLLVLPSLALAQATNPVKLRVGMVAAVDMLALPIAVDLPRPRVWDDLNEDDRFKALSGRVLQLVRSA